MATYFALTTIKISTMDVVLIVSFTLFQVIINISKEYLNYFFTYHNVRRLINQKSHFPDIIFLRAF